MRAPEPGATPPDGEDSSNALGMHLTTFTHEGRFWDVHLEFVADPRIPDSCRARLCYAPSDRVGLEEAVRTAVIIIEPTFEDAERVARGLDRHHHAAMLRSII